MKTITIQELPGPVSEWLQAMDGKEEIAITDHNRIVIRLVPEPKSVSGRSPDSRIDWTTSAAFTRDRAGERTLSEEEIASVLEENKGNW